MSSCYGPTKTYRRAAGCIESEMAMTNEDGATKDAAFTKFRGESPCNLRTDGTDRTDRTPRRIVFVRVASVTEYRK